MKNEIQVNLKTYQRQWRIDRNQIQKFIKKAWPAIRTRTSVAFRDIPAELTVVFLNDKQMHGYNKKYRNRDYTTDVLSFPVNEVLENRYYVGDILISMQKTAKQANEKAHPVDRELKILLLHGMLHLVGYDHETDTGQMDRLENRLREQLIERR